MMEYIPGEAQLTIAANSLCTGVFGELTTALYGALQPAFATIYVLAMTVVLALRRHDYRMGLAFGLTVALSWLPVVYFKVLFGRPRIDTDLLPNPSGIIAADWSFPSGHTAFVAAFMMAVFIFIKNVWARIAGVALVSVISATVLIIGVHYPTDVLASLIWAILVTPVVAALVRQGVDRLPAA